MTGSFSNYIMKKIFNLEEEDGGAPATSVTNMSVDFAPGAYFKPQNVTDRRYKNGRVVLLKRFSKQTKDK